MISSLYRAVSVNIQYPSGLWWKKKWKAKHPEYAGVDHPTLGWYVGRKVIDKFHDSSWVSRRFYSDTIW